MHAHQYSLWLEASLRRVGGATARLAPPFECLITDPGRALAVATSTKGSPSLGAAQPRGLRASTRDLDSAADGGGEDNGERGRGESRGSRRRRGWKRRSPGSRGRAAWTKDGITWVPRALPKLSHSLTRGPLEQLEDEAHGEVDGGQWSFGGNGVDEEQRHTGHACTFSKAHMFDELWLPPGLVNLAQDVLLINRARGGVVVRGEERYFIAQPRGAPSGTAASESGYPLWKPATSKFRALEAAVFPFLLLPLVPHEHQPQAAGQLSCLLDANPANAATLCHLRVPLALLKLACLLPPEQSQVRDLYFRLAAQLMSHHISAADALELFHLASLQPSAWARLGRLSVTSGADLISTRHIAGGLMMTEEGAAADVSDEIRVRHGSRDDGVLLPPNSGELQMQLLYVIGTVVDSPSPAWFFHMNGSVGSGLFAGPLARFPPKRIGYSLSMWLRPAWFSGRPGGETGLFSICGRKENGTVNTLLRVSLRRCLGPGDSSAPPAAAGIGASESDDGDQGTSSDDACAKLQVHASTEVLSGQQPSDAASGAMIGSTPIASALVTEPDVRCSRWQHLVLTHSYSSDAAGSSGQWMDGSITVYFDGERRALVTESATGKSKRSEPVDHGSLAYPAVAGAGASVSVSVGCWEEDNGGGREAVAVAAPMMDAGVVSTAAARFSGQIATVALVEGAWSAETAKASFLRGPGAPPPGKRVVFASPGGLPPTPFLDAVSDVEPPSVVPLGGHGKDLTNQDTTSPAAGEADADPSISDSRSVEGQDRGADEAARASSTAVASESAGQRKGPRGAGAGARVGAAAAAPFSGVSCTPPRECERPALLTAAGEPPSFRATSPELQGMSYPPTAAAAVPPRLSVILAPVRKAIDLKYGVAPADGPPATGNASHGGAAGGVERGAGDGAASSGSTGGEAAGGSADGKSALLSDSMALTVNSLAVAAGCGGKDKDSACDGRVSFRLAKGSGTWVYATTPLHAAVQAAGGFRLCLPFLRMDHARQVMPFSVRAMFRDVRRGVTVLRHVMRCDVIHAIICIFSVT